MTIESGREQRGRKLHRSLLPSPVATYRMRKLWSGPHFTLGAFMSVVLVLQREVVALALRTQSNKRFCSSIVLNMAKNDKESSPSIQAEPSSRMIRLLALHGSEGNGPEFAERLAPLRETLNKANIDLEISFPTAPYAKGEGYAWWTMAPGARSFNADTYVGFEKSRDIVLNAMEQEKPDLVLAHSQGAILVSALLGLNQISSHPPLGYVLNGVAWPNPFAQEMETLEVKDPPRVLFMMGQADRINLPSSAQQVQAALEQADFDVETWQHPGGHSVPTRDAEAMNALSEWIITKLSVDS